MQRFIFIRIILYVIPIIALGSFAYRYINPSGELAVKYDFCASETPYFSGLSPNGRVLDLEKFELRNSKLEILCVQRMVIDPVYFDTRLPQSYRSVAIELNYDKPENQNFQIGVGIDPDSWQWQFADNVSCQSKDASCFVADLSHAQFVNNRYRFIISAPKLADSRQEIKLYNLKLTFKKEPITPTNLGKRVRSFLGFK